jgi:UDP-N-acetylglucosamine--N-acetylmuramyl-(pentapeptide) pyrophosphoryl-undecaprenol N-acetylglucosamine transferase
MGGSQGASAINELVSESLPGLASQTPQWQWVHLAGPTDADALKQKYTALKLKARVQPFLSEMELALGAATAAVSRAGASSLAELAAMRVPAVLVPYPLATDNHQFHNARAFEATGAARLLEHSTATPDALGRALADLVQDCDIRKKMQLALAQWHEPHAADRIAEAILASLKTADGAAMPAKTFPLQAHEPGWRVV